MNIKKVGEDLECTVLAEIGMRTLDHVCDLLMRSVWFNNGGSVLEWDFSSCCHYLITRSVSLLHTPIYEFYNVELKYSRCCLK